MPTTTFPIVKWEELPALFPKASRWERSWSSLRALAGGEECPQGIYPCQHPGWGPDLSLPTQGDISRASCFASAAATTKHSQQKHIKWPCGTCHLSRIHLPSNRCITTKQDLFHYNLSRLDKASKLLETYIKGFSGIVAREAITFLRLRDEGAQLPSLLHSAVGLRGFLFLPCQ